MEKKKSLTQNCLSWKTSHLSLQQPNKSVMVTAQMWVTLRHPVRKNANCFTDSNVCGRHVHLLACQHQIEIFRDMEMYDSTLFKLNYEYTAPYILYTDRCIIPHKVYILSQEQRTHKTRGSIFIVHIPLADHKIFIYELE